MNSDLAPRHGSARGQGWNPLALVAALNRRQWGPCGCDRRNGPGHPPQGSGWLLFTRVTGGDPRGTLALRLSSRLSRASSGQSVNDSIMSCLVESGVSCSRAYSTSRRWRAWRCWRGARRHGGSGGWLVLNAWKLVGFPVGPVVRRSPGHRPRTRGSRCRAGRSLGRAEGSGQSG